MSAKKHEAFKTSDLLRNKKVVSIIPKRETCDTCVSGIFDINMNLICHKKNCRVSWKSWCPDYQSLAMRQRSGEKPT